VPLADRVRHGGAGPGRRSPWPFPCSSPVREDDKHRLIAWNRELTAAHQRLRQALRVSRDSVDRGDAGAARADLLLYCHGFCAALSGHHRGEDAALFPELSARHPALAPVIARLTADHEMIAALLARFGDALTAAAAPDELARHLDGLSAIMESHFRYEERELLAALGALTLDADPRALLGPL
jgi:hemerythrin-like domain-containing protein